MIVREKVASGGYPDDLSRLIDPSCKAVAPTECFKVGHRTVLVEEGMGPCIARQLRATNDLSRIVDSPSISIEPTESSDVGHCAVLVQERMGEEVIRGVGIADDLPGVVDGKGVA